MKLEEFGVYQEAMELGECVWEMVMNWDQFAKKYDWKPGSEVC